MLRISNRRLGILGVLGVGFILGYVAACSDPQPSRPVKAAQTEDEEQGESQESNAAENPEAPRAQPSPKEQLVSSESATSVTGPGQQSTESDQDQAAIRSVVGSFVDAYNAGDASAVAALFAPEAQIIDAEGNTIIGREAIEQVFADVFAEDPESRIEVNIESLRLIGTALAVEVGATKVTSAPGEPPEQTRYTVLHVKRDGGWQMALARDTEGDTPSHYERLQPLAWLVGDWIDEGEDSLIKTSCRWSENKNYLLQTITVLSEGEVALEVSQRIGWDPLSKHIKSWNFDSAGGYGAGIWSRVGEQWIIKATAVRTDGTTASATNVVTPLNNDAYLWQSTDRVVGDEMSPSLEVTIVRKPPEPK